MERDPENRVSRNAASQFRLLFSPYFRAGFLITRSEVRPLRWIDRSTAYTVIITTLWIERSVAQVAKRVR